MHCKIGILELWGELGADGTTYYMRGCVPEKYPTFDGLILPVLLNLYDLYTLNDSRSREELDKSLLAEVNNGRLAQLGIMAFLAEQKVPGSVPVLSSLGFKPYAGEVMAPFAAGDTSLAYVSDMPKVNPLESVR